MARKRGGLAGFYDRNKGFLKKAVPVGLSFIPGVGIPLAAAAGAAMGADTEGKGYFSGFNVGGAIKGGLEGYGLGKGAQSIAGGVKGLLAPKAPDISGAMSRASGMIGQANQQIAANPAFAGGGMPGLPTPNINVGMTPSAGSAVSNLFSPSAAPASMPAPTPMPTPSPTGTPPAGQMRFRQAMYQPQVLAAGVQGLLGAMPDAKSAAMDAQTRLAQQQFDEEKRRFQMEEERKRRIAELLMPYMQQNFPQYLGGR